MKMSICCDNAELLRRQREEIVLMTNELKEQEKQLNDFHQAAIKQNEIKKSMEIKQNELNTSTKALNSEITQLKDQMKKQSEDMELLKTKLKDKDSYIQKQSTKIFRLQALVDKSNQEMLLLKKNNPETKAENIKLNIKVKEQSTRILELKENNLKQNKVIESKNGLIQTSAEHINNLEKSLKKLVEFVDGIKSNKSMPSTQKEVNESDFKVWTKEPTNEDKVLENSNERQLNTILQSLKETWLESNLKYEEVKNILQNKMDESKLNSNVSESVKEISSFNRMTTSSPIIF